MMADQEVTRLLQETNEKNRESHCVDRKEGKFSAVIVELGELIFLAVHAMQQQVVTCMETKWSDV